MENKLTGRGSEWFLFILVLAAVLVLVGCSAVRRPQGWSAGTVSGETLYIGTMQGEVLAVSKETGDTEWRRELPTEEDADKGLYGSPAVTGDTVLVGGYDGVLYAYDKRDGSPEVAGTPGRSNSWRAFHYWESGNRGYRSGRFLRKVGKRTLCRGHHRGRPCLGVQRLRTHMVLAGGRERCSLLRIA